MYIVGMGWFSRPLLVVTVIAAIVMQLDVASGQPENRSPFRVQAEVELPLTVGIGLTAVLLPELFSERTLSAPPCGRCDPDQIWLGLDRGVVQNDSRIASRARRMSAILDGPGRCGPTLASNGH